MDYFVLRFDHSYRKEDFRALSGLADKTTRKWSGRVISLFGFVVGLFAFLSGILMLRSRYLWLTDFSSIVIFLSLVTTSARPKPVMLFIIVFLSLSVY